MEFSARHGICPKFYTAGFSRQNLISTVLVIKTQRMSRNGEIYTADKKSTLPPVVTGETNLTSEQHQACLQEQYQEQHQE